LVLVLLVLVLERLINMLEVLAEAIQSLIQLPLPVAVVVVGLPKPH
jgi:hypothetical protein